MYKPSKSKSFYMAVLAIGLLLPLLSFAQLAGRITHIPVIKADAGQSISLEARLEGTDKLTSARTFYRVPGQTTYKVSEMDVDNQNMTGVIPGDDVNEKGIEYYFEAITVSNKKITYPVGAPSAAKPFRINVTPTGANKAGTTTKSDPAIVILSPEPGSVFQEGEILIALALLQHVKAMDPSNLRLLLNNVDVSDNAIISSEIVTFGIKELRPGYHHIALNNVLGKKTETLISWGFTVKSPKETKKQERKLPFRGSLATRFSHEKISDQERDVATANAQVRGELGQLKWSAQSFITSLENKNLQPQNRYSAMLNYKKLTLKLGDTTPRFSQYTMWGVRNRGLEMNFKGHSFNLDVASGNLLRALDGKIASVEIDTIDGDGDPTNYDPILDTLRADTSLSAGSYQRSLLAIKPGFPISDNVTFSFNILKAKDQLSSVDSLFRGPAVDNLVLGADLAIGSSNRRFRWETEAAVSLYNSDIRGGAMTQAEALENIIIVNQYFEPLPTDSAILDDKVSRQTLASKVFKELSESSLALQSALTMNVFSNELKFGYKSIGRSFKSLGSPGIETDIIGFSVSDRMRLFDNRVYLNFGYDTYQDNVNGRKPSEETLTKNTMSGGLSFYTPPEFPNLNFSTRVYDRSNGAKIQYVTLPDGSADSTGNPVGDATTSYDLSVDQSFNFAGFEHNGVFSYSTSISEDDFNASAKSELNSMTLQMSSRMGQQFETSIAYSMTAQNSQNGLNKVDFNVIALNTRYMLVQKMLWVSAGVNSTFASGGQDADISDPAVGAAIGYALDFSRMDFSIGADAKFGLHHEMGISAYTVSHDDKGYVDSYVYNTATSQWDNIRAYNSESPTAVSQDDMAARLTYTFKF